MQNKNIIKEDKLCLLYTSVILAASLNVTVGCLGQITLGHAGFMSIGAYTARCV